MFEQPLIAENPLKFHENENIHFLGHVLGNPCTQRIICSGITQSFKFTDLQNMYRLLSPIQSGLGVLIQEVEDHIREIGLSAVKSLKGDNVSCIFWYWLYFV